MVDNLTTEGTVGTPPVGTVYATRDVSGVHFQRIHTAPDDFISTNNSTTIPLGISGVFTGTGDDLLRFAAVTITLFSDENSAVNGMLFQFSTDNVNWDDINTFTYTNTNGRRFQFPKTARYFRIVYTNGGTAQTLFRVQTILHTTNPTPSVHRLVDAMSPDRSVQARKVAVFAQVAGSGDFMPIQATATGILRVGGTVDIDAVIPGTGATNLGKAEDDAHSSEDVGVMGLAVRNDVLGSLVDTDSDYAPAQVDEVGRIRTSAESSLLLDEMDVTTGWAALGNDTLNLATDLNHILGTASLIFDKVDGAANTIFAGIDKTISSVDLSSFDLHDVITVAFHLSALTDVAYVFVRLGTNNANYNEWRVDDEDIAAGQWAEGAAVISSASFAGSTGNGWDPSAVTYIAVGVAFDAQNNTLSGIQFDHLAIHTSAHSTAVTSALITSEVSTPNVRLNSYGNAVDTNAGNVSAQTLRVVLPTDQATVPVSAASLPLPSGAATAANQLADGHNVTVDNAAGASAVNVQDGGNSLTIDATSLPLPTGAATAAAQLADGHNVTIDNAAGASAVNIQDGGNVITVDGTLAAVTSITNDVTIAGDVAHDGTDSSGGGPVKMGGNTIAHGTNPTAVAADDRTDWYFNRAGVPFVIGGHPNIVTLRANYTAAQTNAAVVTVAGGSKIVVTRLTVTADNANTVDVQVRIGFAAATTPTTTGVVLSHPGIAAGSGVVEGSGAGILGVGADGEDLRITSEVPTSGSIDVIVSYYTIES